MSSTDNSALQHALKDKKNALVRYEAFKHKKVPLILETQDLVFAPFTEQMVLSYVLAKRNMTETNESLGYEENKDVIENVYKGKHWGIIENNVDARGYIYCKETKEWYTYDHDEEPLVGYKHPLHFSAMVKKIKEDYYKYLAEEGIKPTDL